MKTITVLAVALGLGSLAACNQSPQEEAADNIEANADDVPGMTTDANADAAADAVREAGEENADAVREGADADGNSAN